jgi:hypothetical protein
VTEAFVQSQIRLEAARLPGVTLYRNNVGVLLDANGRPVRFGLANESPALNAVLKSSDLVGWRSVTITPAHVGRTLAVFLAREVKAEGWRRNPRDAHENAQQAWLDLVTAAGGDAAFASAVGTL